jgi:hypothetical protein
VISDEQKETLDALERNYGEEFRKGGEQAIEQFITIFGLYVGPDDAASEFHRAFLDRLAILLPKKDGTEAVIRLMTQRANRKKAREEFEKAERRKPWFWERFFRQ